MIADETAERIIAACAADLAEGARLAVEHGVTGEMFAFKPLRNVFMAAVITTTNSTADRITEVAERAGVNPFWLADICDPSRRPVQCDRSGAVARRVIDAAARRARAEALVAELADLGIEVAA